MSERSEPLRSMATILGGAGEPAPPGARASTLDADVAAGVSAGYRVIDQYVREGQEAARAMWTSGAVPGLGAGARSEADLAALTQQMLRYSNELAGFWSSLLNGATRPGPLGQAIGAQGPISGFDFGGPLRPAPFAGEAPRVQVEPAPPAAVPAPELRTTASVLLAIDARRPVEVSVRYEPLAAPSGLRVHDLRSADEHAPRLTGASAALESGALRVQLKVSEQQPPGVYSGVIVDAASNLPAGTLSVRVLP